MIAFSSLVWLRIGNISNLQTKRKTVEITKKIKKFALGEIETGAK
jgi:predicted nuclease of predicted toxin-antitoxin system